MPGANYRPRFCRSESGRHMCELPFEHEVHRSEAGLTWNAGAKATYAEAVAWAAKHDVLWSGAPLIAFVYGKDQREVRADIRKQLRGNVL